MKKVLSPLLFIVGMLAFSVVQGQTPLGSYLTTANNRIAGSLQVEKNIRLSQYAAALSAGDTVVLYLTPDSLVRAISIAELRSGGSGATPTLQAVTSKDSVTTTQIKARRFIAGTPAQATADTIFFWGDSFTDGYLIAENDRYVNIVAKALGAVAVNLGVNGSTLEGGEPVGNMLDNYLSTIPVWHEGLYASIAYGFNDVYYNYASFTGANFKADYQTILNAFYTKGWPTSHMFLNTPFYMSPTVYAPFAGNPAATEARHIEFVDSTISIGNENSIAVADQYRYIASQPNPLIYIKADSIHFNEAGQLKTAELLLNVINKPVEDNGETIVSTGTILARRYKMGGFDTAGVNYQDIVLDDEGYLAVKNGAYVRKAAVPITIEVDSPTYTVQHEELKKDFISPVIIVDGSPIVWAKWGITRNTETGVMTFPYPYAVNSQVIFE